MRHPKFAKDARVRRAIGLVVPLITVAAIESDPEHLDVALRPLPEGLAEAINGIKRAL